MMEEALHRAAEEGLTAACELIIENGVDVDCKVEVRLCLVVL